MKIARIKILGSGMAYGYLPQTKKWHRIGGSRFAAAGLKAIKAMEKKNGRR